MVKKHMKIPKLPKRPVTNPIAHKLLRSYTVGRRNFSRVCKGEDMVLSISAEDDLPEGIMANILTAMNSANGKEWEKIPFMLTNKKTLTCKFKTKHTGLHSFRAEFSLDNGKSWFRDNIADAWVLVDPPKVRSLRIYTLIPKISGTILDWKDDLKRIEEMGFNAIHLLPITKQDMSQSPYSAKDLFLIEPTYVDEESDLSAEEQLDEFVAEAKKLGIHLCFDLVLNHVGVTSDMSKIAPDWIIPDVKQPDGLRRAKYWCDNEWRYWGDLVLVNYEHPVDSIQNEIWDYMTQYALYWAHFANETGGFVRFDNLHSSNPDFVTALTNKLHKTFPNVGIIAEYFADEALLLRTGSEWRLNLNLATPWDYKFVPQLREYVRNIHRISKQLRYYMPVTSHDSGTPAQEFGGVESTIPRYLAAALLGTGATGIVQGVEYGELEKIDFIGRGGKKEFANETIYGLFIGKVNSILLNHPTFQRGDNCLFVDNDHGAVIAAYRESDEEHLYGFLVVCNFDISFTHHITIDLTSVLGTKDPVAYRELLTDKEDVFSSPELVLSVLPSSGYVFRLHPM